MDEVLQSFANGVYEARISIYDSKTGSYSPKTINGGKSTMFPDDWTGEKIRTEVEAAFRNSGELKGKEQFGWRGVSPSGVVIEGFVDAKTRNIKTAYPSLNQELY